jgi:hypothetical protein
VRSQNAQIQELERLLMQHGVEFKASALFQEPSQAQYSYNAAAQNGLPPLWNAPPSNGYAQPGPSQILQSNQQETNMFRALPSFRSACPGDNYLGVSTSVVNLSSIRGTVLTILGMEIDIADFKSDDMDEPEKTVPHQNLYNKSYQAFLQSTLNTNEKLVDVPLPERREGLTYADWFFRVINPFIPILHKATFMQLLTNMYDDPNFRPSVAELVMVHTVFAIMFFQYAVRNESPEQQAYLTARSNNHYHFAVQHFFAMASSHTLEDAQAMTLICSHIRNFPKPGASWMMSQVTMTLALELGIHRSHKRWSDHNFTPYEIEMRRRIFWSLLAINITMSSRLGRPIFLRLDDIDIEKPEPIDDDNMAELELPLASRSGRCLHRIGIQANLIHEIYLEMYTTLYTVRRQPELYIQTVNRLEGKIRHWRESVPADLRVGSNSNTQEHRVFALYAESWDLEFRMMLRHPAVSMTTDTAFNAENMRICVDCAKKMLINAKQLQSVKSLDTTWYHTATYIMALTITLFSAWERRNEMTVEELAGLRTEMDQWLDIMTDIGALLGE